MIEYKLTFLSLRGNESLSYQGNLFSHLYLLTLIASPLMMFNFGFEAFHLLTIAEPHHLSWNSLDPRSPY